MAKKIGKQDLSALYNLEFYKKQSKWKLKHEDLKSNSSSSSEKKILDKTYDINENPVDPPKPYENLNDGFIENSDNNASLPDDPKLLSIHSWVDQSSPTLQAYEQNDFEDCTTIEATNVKHYVEPLKRYSFHWWNKSAPVLLEPPHIQESDVLMEPDSSVFCGAPLRDVAGGTDMEEYNLMEIKRACGLLNEESTLLGDYSSDSWLGDESLDSAAFMRGAQQAAHSSENGHREEAELRRLSSPQLQLLLRQRTRALEQVVREALARRNVGLNNTGYDEVPTRDPGLFGGGAGAGSGAGAGGGRGRGRLHREARHGRQ